MLKLKQCRRRLLRGAAAALTATAPVPVLAQVQTFQFDIQSQSLDNALRAFARTTRQQVLFDGDLVRGKRAPAVRGMHSAEEALRMLLGGSGLVAQRGSRGAYVIKAGQVSGPTAAQAQVAGSTAKASPVSGEAKNASSLGEDTAGSAAANDESASGTPEILVTGQKSINGDIRRTENDAQPYVVFSGEDIRKSQTTSIEDFLKTRLPMNTTEISLNQVVSSSGNQSAINLRGLGTNQTLILIDGRRLGAGIANGNSAQGDVNGIPVESIERIEILPSTSSGIYGGGATGGVINIITRKDYKGIEAKVTYGNTSRWDDHYLRLDLNGGLNLFDGRTHIQGGFSYAESGVLLAGERNLIQRSRALQMASNAQAYYDLSTPPIGLTPNIRSQNGSNLVLDNGTLLNSPRTFVPIGYAGSTADGGNALVANAGRYNLDLPNDLLGSQQALLSDPQVMSANISVSHEFSSRFKIFADFSWYRNRATSIAPANIPTSVTLAANAPNNPFTTPIVVTFPAPGLFYTTEVELENKRLALGAVYKISNSWALSLDYVRGRSSYYQASTSPVLGDRDGTGPGPNFSTDLGNGTFNVVRDLNAFPANWAPYQLDTPNNYTSNYTDSADLTARLSGSLFKLPAGPVTISSLAERRVERAPDSFPLSLDANNNRLIRWSPGNYVRLNSVSGELVVPVFSKANAFGPFQSLELRAAVRHDDYRAVSRSAVSFPVPSRDGPFPTLTPLEKNTEDTTYTFALRYEPVEGLVFRASTGTGFLPPSATQLLSTNTASSSAVTLVDPKREGVSVSYSPVQQSLGGNAALTPETSRSWSAGAVLSPEWLRGFRLSVDYTRIKKTDEIRGLSAQEVVDAEDLLPGRVVRAPLSAADAARGYTGGVIQSIDRRNINSAFAVIEAVDFQANYERDIRGLGNFDFYLVGTYQPTFRRQTTGKAPLIDIAGFRNGVLEWRANGGVNWTNKAWSAGWNAQYYDSYFIYPGGSLPAAVNAATLNQGSAKVHAQLYNDVYVTYRFSPFGSGKTFEATLGIQNLFDRKPAIVADTGTFVAGYSRYGDPGLRRFHLSLRAGF